MFLYSSRAAVGQLDRWNCRLDSTNYFLPIPMNLTAPKWSLNHLIYRRLCPLTHLVGSWAANASYSRTLRDQRV